MHSGWMKRRRFVPRYISKRWTRSWVTDTCLAILYGVNGCRVHTHVYIDEGYLHDDSPNNPNVTKKKHDLLVPLHFSFILCCLLSEELERVK